MAINSDSKSVTVHYSKRTTNSVKACLVFPVSFTSKICEEKYACHNMTTEAAVFVTAVLEYMTAELLELSGNAARDNQRVSIKPRHIMLALCGDEELCRTVGSIIIPSGGIIPNIHRYLISNMEPGDTEMLREIRRMQKSTDLLIGKGSFNRLVREILQTVNPAYTRISSQAMEALQYGAEDFVVSLLATTQRISCLRNKPEIDSDDLREAQKLKHSNTEIIPLDNFKTIS